MEKLVCDRCGYELTEPDDISLALDGTDAWQNAQRFRGEEPRGVFPCKFYFQCKGEMIIVSNREKKKGLFARRK